MLVVMSLHILQDTVAYIISNTEGLTSSHICGIILQGNGCSSDESSLQWSVDIDPGPKPELNRELNVCTSTRMTFHIAVHFHK